MQGFVWIMYKIVLHGKKNIKTLNDILLLLRKKLVIII